MQESRRNRAAAEHAARKTHESVIRVHLSGGRVQMAQLREASAYFETGPGSSQGVFCRCEWTTILRATGHSSRSKADFKGTFRPC